MGSWGVSNTAPQLRSDSPGLDVAVGPWHFTGNEGTKHLNVIQDKFPIGPDNEGSYNQFSLKSYPKLTPVVHEAFRLNMFTCRGKESRKEANMKKYISNRL